MKRKSAHNAHKVPVFIWCLLASTAVRSLAQAHEPVLVSQGLAGYISMHVPAPPDDYRYGVSLYAAVWPLTDAPLRNFQIGLASIWIVPDNRTINYPLLPTGTVARDNWPERGPSYRDVFQTIEGGLGFWASTHFGVPTAKFRMNGTANGYNNEISSPGWGFGNTNPLKPEEMGIAQLSSRILTPPDGLTFKTGTCGELLGYAWMALPFTAAKSTTAGLPVPTGDQSWTMFLNARNFRGPVAFYTPATWSRISRRHEPASGRGLDSRPGLVTGGAIEINTVPRFTSTDQTGATYTRIPELQFPVDKAGRTVLIHKLTHYSKGALYNDVQSWLNGGKLPNGRFHEAGAIVPTCTAEPLRVRQGEKNLPISGCESWVSTTAWANNTFGLQWSSGAIEPWTASAQRGRFPSYCRQDSGKMVAIKPEQVPQSTGLRKANFPQGSDDRSYLSPFGKEVSSPWNRPGPKAGPYQARLSDGSVCTYYWYRFIDQPSLQDADLTTAEKSACRKRLKTCKEVGRCKKSICQSPTLANWLLSIRVLL